MKSTMEIPLAGEQAGFRAVRGTIKQIVSLRLIAEKYLTLRDEVTSMIILIENLYKRTQSAIRVGNNVTEWFQ